MKLICKSFAWALVLFLPHCPALAQTVTAATRGIVTDSSGAIVARASVTASNVATGVPTASASSELFMPLKWIVSRMTSAACRSCMNSGSGRSGAHRPQAWALLVPASSVDVPSDSASIEDVARTVCEVLSVDATGLTGRPLLSRA